jgi:hypothetical protein
MSTFRPTAEQQQALDLFATGESFAIEAGAGTGKTSTLVMLAEATSRVGRYIAFNKAIVVDAGEKMPANVACSTAHSLAFRAVGRQFSHRLNSGRMRSEEIARRLGIRPIEVTVANVGRKTLAAGFLAGHVMRAVTRFCQTADPAPSRRHVGYIDGIDLPDAATGDRTFDNNRLVAAELEPFIVAAWADLTRRDGQLPFKHDHYLKFWQLSEPVIDADFILFDEVQDADPVMADIVLRQAERGVQVVLVGDSQQAIYEWRGAVNAFQLFGLTNTTFLTQSWRFGEAIAEQANDVLALIPDAALRLRGTPSTPSTVAAVDDPRAVLCRTNAAAVREVFAYLADGRRPHLVGGGKDVVAFARGAQALQDGRRTEHPELACFTSWDEVQAYVDQDPQGDELRLLVKLIDDFGADRIISTLGDRMPAEAAADVIVSTAHKAKGREWDTVRLAGDFTLGQNGAPEPSELRLLYVAVTRARLVLDVTLVPFLAELDAAEDTEQAVEELEEAAELTADAVLDGTIQPERPAVPAACPSCGRTDVVRPSGIIGAHRCAAIVEHG